MNNSKTRTEIERLVEGLDDIPVSDDQAQETMKRLGIDTKEWAASVRVKVAAADAGHRKLVFAEAKAAYVEDVGRLTSRPAEPVRSIAEQRRRVNALIARAPREMQASIHFHKFEEATAEELAEMLKSLRHLLGEDGDDDEG